MKLQMQNIYKSFGANDVLKGVDITLGEGEILALLGENGAGKSTLMNILGGVLPYDRGEILIDGVAQHFSKPVDSLKAGIAFIHQELNLINDLAIYENMFLGRELKTSRGFLDTDTMIKRTEEIFEQIGLTLDPKTMVHELDASYKQFVEIARALMMNASVIIMDEPTTSLTDTEINHVFDMMNKLREQKVSMIFISHKLNEVLRVCTKYVVLRDGILVSEGDVKGVTTAKLAEHMVGHVVRTEQLSRKVNITDEVLRLENLSHPKFFSDINFTLKRGEIIGVTGLLGDGRSELFQSVFGFIPDFTGGVYVNGEAVNITSTLKACEKGIAYIPRNRKENGIVKDMSIIENGSLVTLKKFVKNGFIDLLKIKEDFGKQRSELKIKMGAENDLITTLSGGNQQKIVLAKWLSANPSILIMDNPTQGVDVGAKEEIYDIILKLAEQGVGVVILSSEVPEIIRLCDKAFVMYHGEMVAEVHGDDMNEHNIMRYATGGTK